MVIYLERGANDLHPIISCIVRIQNGLTFVMATYPGCPRKEAVKRVSVL